MLNLLIVLAMYFSDNVYFDNLLGADYVAQGFIHSPWALSSTYDNPAISGLTKNIYAIITESPRNNSTFYVDSEGRSKLPLQGIISPRFSIYYRKIYSINTRRDTPFFVNKAQYSEYTLGLSSSNQTTSLGINLKYLTSLYAYASEDSANKIVLDFGKGFTQDIGICVGSEVFIIGAAYDNVFGNIWWEGKGKVKLPSRFFFHATVTPFKNLLNINFEFEKNPVIENGVFKGGFNFNVPYRPKGWEITISGGYLTDKTKNILTYGISLRKGVFRVASGFDDKGNLTLTVFTQGQ